MEKGELRNTWRREISETHGEHMEKGELINIWRRETSEIHGEGITHLETGEW